mmetsp:Transcript_3189/g.6430  ORF Transcript_3189/g.6430 Transcript_3189/m.6430 type:complete len:81 (-) Transcript_3189:842-1084(-)
MMDSVTYEVRANATAPFSFSRDGAEIGVGSTHTTSVHKTSITDDKTKQNKKSPIALVVAEERGILCDLNPITLGISPKSC